MTTASFLRYVLSILGAAAVALPLMYASGTSLGLLDSGPYGIAWGVVALVVGCAVWIRWEAAR